jgi:hypothetical protein
MAFLSLPLNSNLSTIGSTSCSLTGRGLWWLWGEANILQHAGERKVGADGNERGSQQKEGQLNGNA